MPEVSRRPARKRERGNAMLLSMIVLTALATLSGLTVVSVQGGIATSSNDRFHAMALYAAESGGAVAMDFMRKNVDATTGWSVFVTPGNTNPVQPALPGNNAAPGTSGNLFSPDMQASYSVAIYNNRNDPNFLLATNTDSDKQIIIRSTGYGPNGAMAVIEWEISAANVTGLGRPCTSNQKNQSEDGAGRNDCLGNVDFGTVTKTTVGGP